MDPVSALGLAAAIVQLLDFAGKVTNGARQIYISGADAPAVDADVGTCALELDALCNRLKTSHLVPQTPDDKALCRLASRCSAISKELSDFLKSIKAKNPDKRWQCFLSSVKSQLRKSQRDDLLTRLSECRAQLTIQLSRLIRYSSTYFVLQAVAKICTKSRTEDIAAAARPFNTAERRWLSGGLGRHQATTRERVRVKL